MRRVFMNKRVGIVLLLLMVLLMTGCNVDDQVLDASGNTSDIEQENVIKKASIKTSLLPDSSGQEGGTQETTEEESKISNANTTESKSSEKQTTNHQENNDETSNIHKVLSNDSNNTDEDTKLGSSSDDSVQKEEEKDSNTITVIVSIDANTAHAKGYIDYAWILGNTEVEMEKGCSAWDVLSKVSKSKGIPVVKRGSGNNLYISHINSLGEFDFEQGSGWMYNVNGWYPNYGCDNSKSELKDGDKLQWRFTLNVGKDLGTSMS